MDDTNLDQTKASIERMIEEFRNASISLENYGKYFNKLESNKDIINSQIENISRERKDLHSRINDLKRQNNFKEAERQQLMPTEIYNLQMRSNKLVLNAYSWQTLLNEMFQIVFDKMNDLFDEVKAYSIKKGALEEMREDGKRIQETMIKQSENVHDTMIKQTEMITEMTKDSVDNKIEMMERRYETFQQAMLSAFTQIISKIELVSNDSKVDAIKVVDKMNVKPIVAPKNKFSKKTSSHILDLDESKPMAFNEDDDEDLEEDDYDEFGVTPPKGKGV